MTLEKSKKLSVSLKEKIKIPKFIKKHKIISIIILALIVLIILFSLGRKEEVATTTVSDYKVGYSNISVTITGSGTLEANEQYDITSLVSGEVLSDYFQEGDLIEEESIMYEIDASNAQSTITRAQNSLEKAQNQYIDATENVANLNVKSKINGIVTEVNAKKGDKISQNTHMFTVVDYETLILSIYFNEEDAKSIHIGDIGEVYLTDSNYVLEGEVESVSSGAIISSYGTKISQVKMKVKNPGTLVSGDTATAIVSGVACASEGVFEENAIEKVNALVAGDVSKINVTVGDKVTNGSVLAVIESSNTNKSLREAQLSYTDAQTSLADAYDTLDNYTIKAPITGTVIKKTTKAGDKISQGSGQTVMAIVADMTKMKFTIYVDELDITKMKEGSKVKVTADAVEGKMYEGYIDNISIVGTTSNSVTTYPVTVVVEEYGELIPGMNVDAEITVAEAKDVLSVPLSAVQRGSVVYVKNEDLKDSQKPKDNDEKNSPDNKAMNPRQQMFEGYTAVPVKTGLSSSNTVEIVEGLYEGQRVAVISIAGSGNSLMEDMMRMSPMGGGRMPSGGMNGGGMSGGGFRQ